MSLCHIILFEKYLLVHLFLLRVAVVLHNTVGSGWLKFAENKRAVIAGEMKMNMSPFSEVVSPHIF